MYRNLCTLLYEVTYSCQDDANNNAVQVSRTVIVDAVSDITVQVITLTAVYNIRNGSTLKFDDPRSITTFESGGHTYAAVTSHNDDGVQILDVTGPSSITAAGSITDNAGLELDRAIGITVFESGGHTYAAVTSYNAVQIIRIDIIVPDNTPPVITLNGPATVMITVGDTYSDQGSTCTDNIDGSIVPTSTSTVDSSLVGTYSVTYSCQDSSDNHAMQVSRIVIVQEQQLEIVPEEEVPETADHADEMIEMQNKLNDAIVEINKLTSGILQLQTLLSSMMIVSPEPVVILEAVEVSTLESYVTVNGT